MKSHYLRLYRHIYHRNGINGGTKLSEATVVSFYPCRVGVHEPLQCISVAPGIENYERQILVKV